MGGVDSSTKVKISNRGNSRRRTSALNIPNERTLFIGLWKTPIRACRFDLDQNEVPASALAT
jgi:hypothetical protein